MATAASSSPAAYSMEQLVTKAQSMIDSYQPELAVKFYEKALLMQPNEVRVLDLLGEACLQAGLVPQAHSAWSKSIELAPGINADKYLNMAQIVEGDDAEKFALTGISILKSELKENPESAATSKLICDAYCSLAELYVTDLCYHEEAESKVESYLALALSFDAKLSPEPYQGYANLRLIQNRPEEAAKFIYEAYVRICNLSDDTALPSMEFRIVTGKLLMETSQFKAAVDILEGVMLEDDENAELWYLVGKCYVELSEPEIASEFLEKCRAMLLKMKESCSGEFTLENQLQEVCSLLN